MCQSGSQSGRVSWQQPDWQPVARDSLGWVQNGLLWVEGGRKEWIVLLLLLLLLPESRWLWSFACGSRSLKNFTALENVANKLGSRAASSGQRRQLAAGLDVGRAARWAPFNLAKWKINVIKSKIFRQLPAVPEPRSPFDRLPD